VFRLRGSATVGRMTSVVLAVALIPVAAVSEPGGSGPAGLEWLRDLRLPDFRPESRPIRPAESAGLGRDVPAAVRTVRRPGPGADVVTLGRARQSVPAVGGVALAARSDAAAGARVRTEVLDVAAASRAGVSGFAFRLSSVDGTAGVPVTMSVDYSGFAHAFGGGYADRLRLVALPDCALVAPRPAGCALPRAPLAARNDVAARRLIADAPVGAGTVFAVTADASGEPGNFAASPLGVSAAWQVAPGTGEFSWSYRMNTPQPPIGAAPTVGLSYSSGAIDGLVSTRNTQGPPSGVGWSDFATSFVERRYETCTETGDLCWKRHNATISLNGRSSELVATDGTYDHWVLKQDPGWLVDHLHGTYANGDENREYWRVTTPDGTRYFFGLGNNPDTGAATNSVWTVPVFADDDNEPCRSAPGVVGVCTQAWRWNLDRVVDTNGITTTYVYGRDTNKYRSLGALGADAIYVRAGHLARIEYGKPAGTGTEVFPAGRVIIETQDRTPFGDVPTDLSCSANCFVVTPSFFSSRRYSAVRSEVRAGNAWRPVEQVNLYHEAKTNADGHTKLYLASVSRVGLTGATSLADVLVLPSVEFGYTELANRVDVNAAAGKTRMGHFRLTRIVDEFGGTTLVTYGQTNPCANGYAGPWETNARDCFPQKLGSQLGVFHKYLTTRVEHRDATGGGVPAITTYAYEGPPAWHHDDDEFVRGVDQSWSDWRGYGTTLVTEGTERTRIQVYRGMNGDNMPGGATRTAFVTPLPGTGFGSTAVPDQPWLAGAVLTEARLGTTGDVLTSTLHEYQSVVTARPSNDPKDNASWMGESRTTMNTASTGTATAFSQQRTTTTYNATLQPTAVYEEGRLDRTGDERCTRTTYATIATIVANPSGTTVVAGDCSATAVLSQSETSYDTRGNAIRQRIRVDSGSWLTTAETVYDAFGRAYRVTDARGLVTETTHELTPNGGYPLSTSITQRADGRTYTSSTQWLPERGTPLRETDENGFVTTYTYDRLGRTTSVRQPTEQSAPADILSWQFEYAVSNTKSVPPIVHTRRLQSLNPTRYNDSWVVFDSLLRPRQTQAFSPDSGKAIVSATSYNDRGLVEDSTEPQAVTGPPGWGLLPVAWENLTRTTYDVLGRVARQGWHRGGVEQWATVTTYTHDTTTVQQPGGRRSSSVIDGLGRTVQVAEYDGAAWQTTSQGHDQADRLTSIVDPAGNRITYTFNLAGWRLSQDDPDSGRWTFGYDSAGNQTTVTDAKGGVIVTAYDQLGRPTVRRSGSATGAVRARWFYDAAGELGRLDRSVRVDGQGEWVVDVAGYDSRGRALGTTWTVPAGVPGLSGVYPVTYGYDRADNVTSVRYPPVGGLPQETVTTAYNTFGLAETMTGLDEYVWAATYDGRARPASIGLGPRPGGQPWLARNWTYDADQRAARIHTVASGSTVVDHQFGYDLVGSLLSRTTTHGAQAWRECYGYDVRDRLTSAYTTTASACDGTGRGTGAQPYNHTYAYSSDGNLRTRVENGTTHTYAYPTGSGVDRPHAPTAVGADRYTWDANGHLAARTVAGRAETLAWDADRLLASVSGPSGTTAFVYDADGGRLLRSTPAGRTLYIADHEVTANPAGTTVTAVRSYEFGGEPVATRTPSGVDYVVTDQQGSTEATLPAGGTIEVARTYTPYGRKRSGGKPDTDQGWLGQIEDESTSLSYLNARYDDPSLGRFTAPDPVYDPAEPGSLNPYAYALNNPVNNSDPSGLWTPIGNGGGPRVGYDARWSPSTNTNNIARSMKVARNSRAPLSYWVGRVQRKLDAYNRSALHQLRAAAVKRLKDAATLRSMARANPDPNFWRAVAKAGSGQALVLMGLRAANPDPGFWKAVAEAGGAKRLLKIAQNIERSNGVARRYGFGRGVHFEFPCLHHTDGGCVGGGIDESIGNFGEAVVCDINRAARYPNRVGCGEGTQDYLDAASREIYAGCVNGLISVVTDGLVGGVVGSVIAASASAAANGGATSAAEAAAAASAEAAGRSAMSGGVKIGGAVGFVTICISGIITNHLQVQP
jgi:RHS repeat-associated protein